MGFQSLWLETDVLRTGGCTFEDKVVCFYSDMNAQIMYNNSSKEKKNEQTLKGNIGTSVK